jgi:hypothetical protein
MINLSGNSIIITIIIIELNITHRFQFVKRFGKIISIPNTKKEQPYPMREWILLIKAGANKISNVVLRFNGFL